MIGRMKFGYTGEAGRYVLSSTRTFFKIGYYGLSRKDRLMQSSSLTSNPARKLGATFPVVAIHAFIPLFWLFCAMFIIPRFAYVFAQLDAEAPILFNCSALMCKHWFVYLFVLVSILIADGAIHRSLLRLSNRTMAGLWLAGVVVIELAISLLLYLPLVNAVVQM